MCLRRSPGYSRSIAVVAGCCVALLVNAGSVFARVAATGRVIDDHGDAVAGAVVEIVGRSIHVTSGIDGRFVIDDLPAGRYRLTAARIGYRLDARVPLQVTEDGTARIVVRLRRAPIVLPLQRTGAERVGEQYTSSARRYVDVAALRARGVTDFRAALAELPGVTLIGGDGAGAGRSGATYISLDAEHPRWVSVTLDGVPLHRDLTGAVDLSAIPFVGLAGIEIVHGSQSASVGGGAIAGVVNLITGAGRRDGAGWEAIGETGAFGRAAATVGASIRRGQFRGRLDARGSWHGDRYRYTDSSGATAARGNVGRMNRSVFGSGRSGERLHWSAFVSGRRDGAPGALFQLTPGAVSRSARARVQGTWQDVAVAGWPLRFTAWWEDIVEAYRSPGVIRSDVRYGERFIGASVQSEIAAGALRGAWQIEAAHERLSGEDFIKPRYSFGARHRSLAAVRLNGTVTRDVGRGLRVVAAGSYARDMDDQFGGFDSPRAMAALSRPGMWRLAVGAGRSFHRPLLTSLFWKRDAFSEGNPLLRPEHGAELEATGSVTPVRGLELQTRYYRRRVTDIIVWERDHLGRFRPRNYDRADITGRDDRVTFEMLGQSLSLVYGHAFQIATDRSGERNHDGKTLIFRPRHTHTGTVRASVGRLTVQWRGRWVSRRFIRRMNNKVLGPFRMIDLDVHLRIHTRRPNVLLRLRGENVTDEWVELIERYPEPGRRYSVGMEFGW